MKWLLTACLLVSMHHAACQYRFSHITSKDGLSQNSVTDIYQDSRGYIWIATQDGLNRYDGHSFQKFETDGHMPLIDNFVWDITEDATGDIWVASRKGATRLNINTSQVTHFLFEKGNLQTGALNQVSAINMTAGEVLLSNSYGACYLLQAGQFGDSTRVVLSKVKNHLYPNNPEGIPVLFQANRLDKKWIFHGDRVRLNDATIPFPEGHQLTSENNGLIWLASGFLLGTTQGLLYFDIRSMSFQLIPEIQSFVFDLLAVDDFVWVATASGIAVLDKKSLNVVHWIKQGEDDEDLRTNVVTTLYRSNEGLIWVGTANGGIHLHDPRKEQFKFLKRRDFEGATPVWAVAESGRSLWIGAEDGLYRVHITRALTSVNFAQNAIGSVEKVPLPILRGNRITAIASITDKQLLAGTSSGELIAVNTDVHTVKKVNLPVDHHAAITSILSTPAYVWVATLNGLFQFNSELVFEQRVKLSEHFPNRTWIDYLLALYIDRKGNIWVGSNMGCYKIKQGGRVQMIGYNEAAPAHSPAFNFISGFYEDAKGRIWMATYGGGVSVLDTASNTFTHLNTVNGLANNVCNSLIGTQTEIWVATNAGVSRIDQETFAIKSYSQLDGLVNSEFVIGSKFNSSGGELFFGGVDGLVVFHPDHIRPNQPPPAPLIDRIAVNYAEIPGSRFVDGLHLSPDERALSIQFGALDYRFMSEFQYEYKLEGFDKEWVRTTSERQATYTPPFGTYTFKVRTIHNEQLSPETILHIRVTPPFYFTSWFMVLSILLVLSTTILLARYFSHRKLQSRLRELEMQQKIQNERARISRDLHDNIGSHITYIASSLDNLADPAKAHELGNFARQTMNQLRETIWAINHDQVDLAELKLKIVGFLAHALQHQQGIRHEVTVEDTPQALNPTTAIYLFRIVQEAVNNTLKHANATEIKIAISITGLPTLTISDDGYGFDGQDKEGHYGLANLRNRAAEIGGTFVLETEPNRGTRITISGFEIGRMT